MTSATAVSAPRVAHGASIAVTTDVSPAEWDAYVASHPHATAYHQWRWRDVFTRGLRLGCRYLAARRDGRVEGVLPIVQVRGWLPRGPLSSLPYVNYGGVLASTGLAAASLLDEAASILARERRPYLVLRHRERQCPALPARTHKQTMLLALAESRDAMWTGLDHKVRNQVRKAQKSGLEYVSGGAERLDDFYGVFARNMRDLGTPVYGRPLFQAILETFPGDARVHAVRLNGATVAAALAIRYRDVVEVPSASSLREHRGLCPNHLLYWNIIEASIAEGARVLDFGRSSPGDGTFHFKEQWGARPSQLWWEYVLSPGRQLPAADRHDPKFGLAIAAWQRLPLRLANAVGPRIVRAVP